MAEIEEMEYPNIATELNIIESIRPIRTAENFEAVEWATGFSNKHGLPWLR